MESITQTHLSATSNRAQRCVLCLHTRECKRTRLCLILHAHLIILWKWAESSERGGTAPPAVLLSRKTKLGVITVKLCYSVIFGSDTVVRGGRGAGGDLELMMWLKYWPAPSNDYRGNLLHLSSNQGGRAIFRMGVVTSTRWSRTPSGLLLLWK